MTITNQDYVNLILLITTYGITAWILLMTSIYIVNRFWIDSLERKNIKNHITAETITAKQNNYKEVA